MSRFLGLFLLGILFLPDPARAAQFGFGGGFQYTKLSDLAGGGENYVFNPTLRFQDSSWYLSGLLPIVLKQSEATNTLSTGGTGGGMGTSGGMGSSSGGGLGDLLLNGAVEILGEIGEWPSIWLGSQLKTPTSMSGYGTGKFDYGAGAALRKTFGDFLTFLDLNYQVTGDSEGTTYRNPLFAGVGGGPVFADGKWSVLAYYQASTSVLEGYAGQQQVSAGLNLAIGASTYLYMTASQGLTDSTADRSFSVNVLVY